MHVTSSQARLLASLPDFDRQAILARMTEEQAEELRLAEELRWDWEFWSRPEQRPPDGDWTFWLYLAGRGTGKTRSGAEWLRSEVSSGRAARIALIAETARRANP